MSTKGPSFKYGNTNGSRNNGLSTIKINYQFAKDYNKYKLEVDFKKHKTDFGVSSKEEYSDHAIHFANVVDIKNCISFVDKKGTTHKYNIKTNTYIAVDKKGYVITYFKPKTGIKYFQSKKRENKK